MEINDFGSIETYKNCMFQNSLIPIESINIWGIVICKNCKDLINFEIPTWKKKYM